MQPLAAVNIREQPNDRNITEIGLHCVQWNSAIICKMQLQLSAKMVCNFLQKGLAKNNFCGGGIFSRSDGLSQDMTLFTEKADLLTVVKSIKKWFSPKSITLLGCSQGGFVSGLLAAELGEKVVDRLILFYPAVCIPDDARKGKMMFFRFDPNHIPAVLGRFPMKLGGDYARTVIGMNPYEAMKGYNGPVLLLHGTADKIVNIRYARKLREIYPNCRYEEIEGGGHMFKGKADQQACLILRNFMET